MWTRRTLLSTGLAAALLPRRALAFGGATKVDVAELDLGPGTEQRATAWQRLMYDVQFTTSVDTEAQAVTVRASDAELFEHPFCVLQGNGRFAMPDEQGLEQLSRYLSYGGFLFIDDMTGARDSGFDESVRKLAGLLFPTRSLAPVPVDHSVYRAFFLMKRPYGRLGNFDTLEAITVGNISPLIYSRNDVGGALLTRSDGRPTHACVPGGESQRREARKLAMNLVLYSLTANYKRDQAHVRELMREGRLE